MYRNCGDMGSGVCGSGEKIVYAWGRNAPELKLPNGKYSIFSGPFKHLCKQHLDECLIRMNDKCIMHKVHPIKMDFSALPLFSNLY